MEDPILSKQWLCKHIGVRGMAVVSGDQTIARLLIDFNTGELMIQDVEGHIRISENCIRFNNLTSNYLKIVF